MERLHKAELIRSKVRHWRKSGKRVGLVPTMGALHHGHLSLVEQIAQHVDHVIVSIFVNPTQFGEGEDFDAYPRQLDKDCAVLADTPADIVYAPDVAEIYPNGFSTKIHVYSLTEDLEGAHRIGHFDGVTTIVAKLFLQTECDAAIFGEKDYQQLAVVRQMVKDLDMPIEIFGAPIVREEDGLAASSRNAYLSADQRAIAGRLNLVLSDLKAKAEDGAYLQDLEEKGKQALLDAGFTQVDYLTFRDADSLVPVNDLSQPTRLLAVARLGRIRLLDNKAVGTLS